MTDDKNIVVYPSDLNHITLVLKVKFKFKIKMYEVKRESWGLANIEL
jgi:hypothetical protein